MEDGKQYPLRIIVTGPESTGKTELVEGLSKEFQGELIPEYAREYIENLGKAYTYDDVVHVAERQVRKYNKCLSAKTELIFIDTYLIITKIWFTKVFREVPEWIDAELSKTKADFYLLCKPDIPWVPDKVRENGGEMRETLFNEYKDEIMKLGAQHAIISGTGYSRLQMAIDKVNMYIHTK